MMRTTLNCLMASALFAAAPALADNVFFEEGFDDNAANWFNRASDAPLTHFASGGADGGGYVSSATTFENDDADDTTVLFRGEGFLGSSGLGFAGAWIDEGVNAVTFSVRHNAPVPVNFFTRFSPPARFPGGVAVEFAPVPPNTWTEISFAIDADDPRFVSFEGQTFESVFSSVGNLQTGVRIPAPLAGSMAPFTFDLDNLVITAVPEPTGLVLVLVSLAAGVLGRRRTH